MLVNVRYATGNEAQYLNYHHARGVTRFWGNSPTDTDVLLHEDANDAAVYEEYLHVLRGQARGWTAPGSSDALIEEIQVGRQVLAHAGKLQLTSIEHANIQRTIASYISALVKMGIPIP